VPCVEDPPEDEYYEPRYEPSFAERRRFLGLSGPNFDYFFRAAEEGLCRNPWLENEPVPEGGGIRMRPLRGAPDLPPLYIYYRIERNPNRIIFYGLSRNWSNRGEQIPPL
jgi:hypothetical protein